jgi:hypothetical protein
MELKQKLNNYFKLSDEEKYDVCAEIIKIYKEENQFDGLNELKFIIAVDILSYEQQEEFELVQALTDIEKTIKEVEEELKNGRL